MIDLNLLPWREIDVARSRKLLLKSIFLYTVLAMLVLLFSYLVLSKVNAFYFHRLAYIKNSVAQLERDTKPYPKIQKIRNKAMYIMRVIHHVDQRRYFPIVLLNSLSKIMPEGLSLSQLSISDEKVSFSGSSTVSNLIISFERNLLKTGLFENVKIEQVSLKKEKDSELYTFVINAPLKDAEINRLLNDIKK